MMDIRHIAVRTLVEFILREGSIDSRISNLDPRAASEGVRLHRKVQTEAGSNYQAEVAMQHTVELAGEQVIIEGRADGVILEEGQYTIDEIKTSARDYEAVAEEQLVLYWAQAKCYAYMLAQAEGLEQLDVQLTYIATKTGIITKNCERYSMETLTLFWDELVGRYEAWVAFTIAWCKKRNQSLQDLTFPYGNYRPGQRELAVGTYKTIATQQRLFIEAPTGIGKTMSTLFPATKAIGEGLIEKIFYLTAKTITRQVAVDAAEALHQNGARIKTVELTAKDTICFLEKRNCTPEACPFADGYYTRLNTGIMDLLENEEIDTYSRAVIEQYARKHKLCPFEFSLDVSLWCDIIIGDYNYAFDPIVYLRRFFQAEKMPYAFLIDEAHNLVSRAKDMFSAEITDILIVSMLDLIPPKERQLLKALQEILDELDLIGELMGAQETMTTQVPHEHLLQKILKFTERMKDWLPENQVLPEHPELLKGYFNLLTYTKISELFADDYCMFFEKKYERLLVKQMCLDPARLLSTQYDKVEAAILFSASLSPLPYYSEVLGGSEQAVLHQVPSPFTAAKQLIVQTSYIQTTYKQRAFSYDDIVESIYQMIMGKNGNYFVFFPSYTYMQTIYELFSVRYPDISTVLQENKWNEQDRQTNLALFVENPEASLLGFFVLGGAFSEGIDLKGSRLIGVAIVGVGLPQMHAEQEVLRTYFQDTGRDGFQYAYQIPGMNKVVQAAGRVIRDVSDTGVILLLDSRFGMGSYQSLLPPYWGHLQQVSNPRILAEQIRNFWQRIDGT